MIWPLRKRVPVPAAITLVGKLPCQADFLREGGSSAESAALDSFLVQARPGLQESRAGDGIERLPTLWLCQCLPKQRHGLVGLCAPSRDAAGRSFPVAMASAFDAAAQRPRLGYIFEDYRPFLNAAEVTLRHLPDLDLPAVRDELATLLPLAMQAGAAGACSEARPTPPSAAADLWQIFGSDRGAIGYALYTIAAAFAADQPGLTLDCPTPEPSSAQLWLTLIAALAARVSTTICVLYAPDTRRLLLAIGGWNPILLRAMAEPGSDLDRLWPLTTANQAACDDAARVVQGVLPEAARSSTLGLASLADQLALLSKTLRA